MIRAAARVAPPWPSGRGGYNHDSHYMHCFGLHNLACLYIVGVHTLCSSSVAVQLDILAATADHAAAAANLLL